MHRDRFASRETSPVPQVEFARLLSLASFSSGPSPAIHTHRSGICAVARSNISIALFGCRRPSATARGASAGVPSSLDLTADASIDVREIGNVEYALLRPSAFCHIAHQIGRVADEVIATAEIVEIVVAAEAADQCVVRRAESLQRHGR